jgi:glycine/D-amino acid oxidase-like deaminating enzyme
VSTTKSVYQRGLDGPVAGPKRRGDKRVAIIGAGACGICAAKYLLEVGFDVTVFESGFSPCMARSSAKASSCTCSPAACSI